MISRRTEAAALTAYITSLAGQENAKSLVSGASLDEHQLCPPNQLRPCGTLWFNCLQLHRLRGIASACLADYEAALGAAARHDGWHGSHAYAAGLAAALVGC